MQRKTIGSVVKKLDQLEHKLKIVYGVLLANTLAIVTLFALLYL